MMREVVKWQTVNTPINISTPQKCPKTLLVHFRIHKCRHIIYFVDSECRLYDYPRVSMSYRVTLNYWADHVEQPPCGSARSFRQRLCSFYKHLKTVFYCWRWPDVSGLQFLWGRPHGADLPPMRRRPPEPDPLP